MAAVVKSHYHEHEDVALRSEEEIATFRSEKKIHVEGKGAPRPISTFEEASFPGMI